MTRLLGAPPSLQLLVLTWPYNAIYLVIALWTGLLERPVRLRSRLLPRTQDRHSGRVIQVGAAGGAVLALGFAILLPAAAIPAPHALYWSGIMLVVASSLLRVHCFRMLGASFTGVVHVVPEQPVVQRGIYRWVRHPAYTAGAMSLVGIGLVLANWASLVALLLVCIIIYSYRVHVEEQALVATLGAAYREYQAHTKRFVPLLF